jgi:hypothetical protein
MLGPYAVFDLFTTHGAKVPDELLESAVEALRERSTAHASRPVRWALHQQQKQQCLAPCMDLTVVQ